MAEMRDYDAGEFVYRTGEKTSKVYGVVTGRVRASLSGPDGQEFAVTDMENGYWFGEPTLGCDEPRIMDARVFEPSKIICLNKRLLLEVAEANPTMYRNLFHYQVQRTRAVTELMGGMLFYPLSARIGFRLITLAEEYGEARDGGVYVNTRMNQNDFARLSMGSRQRVNKILRSWNERGLIESQGDSYFIPNLDALRLELTDALQVGSRISQ